MAEKRNINLAIPEQLLEEFNKVCKLYGHGKQKGMVLSAAIAMFLKADPRAQGQSLEEVMHADIRDGVEDLLERARKEQALRIATADALERKADQTPGPSSPQKKSSKNPRKAAKKRGRAVRSIKKLPSIDDLT